MLHFTFTQRKSPGIGPRLGQLRRGGRKTIETPHYVAITSRGVVPHIAHDALQKHTTVSSMYLGLEDFIEKQIHHAPIFRTPARDGESPLCKYIAAQDDVLTILAPRRSPALPCPVHNSGSAISICTSVGFSQLGAEDYHNAIQVLRPDIAITMADVITAAVASVKRVEKSADRTREWLRSASQVFRADRSVPNPPAIFAAIPPLDHLQQSSYLQDLAEEYRDLVSGVALYSSNSAADLPKALVDVPRLCLSEPASPHAVLDDMVRGADLLTIPFIASSSENGTALTFEFPGPTFDGDRPQPLGIDLWSPTHEKNLSPLSPGCDCYTCTRHHSAYVHHLLHTKEMLGWTLLQLHNHAIIDHLFEASRRSIAKGTFEEDVKAFNRNHEAELPVQTGLGPRIKGYQTKSVGGGEAKRNTKAWSKLDDTVKRIAEPESGVALSGGDSESLEDQGFAEKV